MENFGIIIPAYQAEKSIKELIIRIRLVVPDIRIIIIDDGSTDNTPQIAREFKEVIYKRLPVNKGKGYALQQGIQLADNLGLTHLIFMDADLQHPPELIPQFLEMYNKMHMPVLLGKRQFSIGVMPFHRILSNTITSFMISLRTMKRVHDSQCGFRLIATETIKSISVKSHGFQYESESLLKLLIQNTPFVEIPIPTIYNKSHSSINNLLDTVKFIKLFLASYFW